MYDVIIRRFRTCGHMVRLLIGSTHGTRLGILEVKKPVPDSESQTKRRLIGFTIHIKGVQADNKAARPAVLLIR